MKKKTCTGTCIVIEYPLFTHLLCSLNRAGGGGGAVCESSQKSQFKCYSLLIDIWFGVLPIYINSKSIFLNEGMLILNHLYLLNQDFYDKNL